MSGRLIAILGGSGFVGRTLCEHLVRNGDHVRVLSRHPRPPQQSAASSAVGWQTVNAFAPASLAQGLQGADAVVNLVGILNERGDDGRDFVHAHVDLTRSVIAACEAAGISRYLHMSALQASPVGPSHYLRTKGEAETLVKTSPLAWTIFRPSVIFGPGDGLFGRFSQLLRLSPVLPLACASARFQPVFVGDVAEAFVRALDETRTVGQSLDLGGPRVLSLGDIVRYTAAQLGLRRVVLPLGLRASRAMAEFMEYLPGKPFSRDNFRSATLDSVLATGIDGLQALSIAATDIDAVIPAWLGHPLRKRRAGTT